MKDNKTAKILIGAVIFLIIAVIVWYALTPGSIPDTVSPAPGKTPVKTPVPLPDNFIPVNTSLGTAYAKYETTVWKKDFKTQYKRAKTGEYIGKILGSSGDWTIVQTTDPSGTNWVYTDSIYVKY